MPHDPHTRGLPRRSVSPRAAAVAVTRAADALVDCYARLAQERIHLLAPILEDRTPVQWEHYPGDDAINRDRRYQWFYHSHDPEDRAGAGEHGHIHLFARMEGIAGDLDERAERDFLRSLGTRHRAAKTRHLLAIGLNPVGVPISLFTVNRWVTGDLPLAGDTTIALLEVLRLDTGYSVLDTVIQSILGLYRAEIRNLITERDAALLARAARGAGALEDRTLEVPAFLRLDVDRRLADVLRAHARRRARSDK